MGGGPGPPHDRLARDGACDVLLGETQRGVLPGVLLKAEEAPNMPASETGGPARQDAEVNHGKFAHHAAAVCLFEFVGQE